MQKYFMLTLAQLTPRILSTFILGNSYAYERLQLSVLCDDPEQLADNKQAIIADISEQSNKWLIFNLANWLLARQPFSFYHCRIKW